MNKILRLTTVGVLISSLSLATPLLWAEDNTAASMAATSQAIDKTFNENALSFILRHQVGEAPASEERIDLPFDKLDSDPMAALKQLIEHVAAPIKSQTSAGKITTQMEILIPAEGEAKIGKLPTLTVTTTVDATGAGKSDILLPAFKVNEEKENVNFNLGEIAGHVTFEGAREKFAVALTANGFDFIEKNNVLNIGKVGVSGDFNAALMPSQLDFNMADFKVIEDETEVVFKNIVANAVEKLSSQGVDISPGKFSLGQFSLTENGATIDMKDFVVSFEGSEKGELINYNINSSLGKLIVPAEITMDEAVDLNYVGNIEFHNLSAKSLLAVQEAATEVMKNVTNPEEVADQMMLAVMGKFMEVLPEVLAQSPELAITKLLINTTQGTVDGQMTVGLEGKKATGLDENTLLAALLAHSNITFTVNKAYLLKMLATETEGNLKDAEDMLKALIAQYKVPVTEAVDQYKVNLEASFKDGQPTMNDAAQAVFNIYMESQQAAVDEMQDEEMDVTKDEVEDMNADEQMEEVDDSDEEADDAEETENKME
jgi:hypothetical protein